MSGGGAPVPSKASTMVGPRRPRGRQTRISAERRNKKTLVGRSCICSCMRTRLLSPGRRGERSRETQPCLPGRSTEVVEVVALEQMVNRPDVVLVDDPVGNELPE